MLVIYQVALLSLLALVEQVEPPVALPDHKVALVASARILMVAEAVAAALAHLAQHQAVGAQVAHVTHKHLVALRQEAQVLLMATLVAQAQRRPVLRNRVHLHLVAAAVAPHLALPAQAVAHHWLRQAAVRVVALMRQARHKLAHSVALVQLMAPLHKVGVAQ